GDSVHGRGRGARPAAHPGAGPTTASPPEGAEEKGGPWKEVAALTMDLRDPDALISTEGLAARLGQPGLRVYDCATTL
ncbi:MAG TPA: hypothetical protein VFP19_02120, partial [Candidatus Limnocylindrales bacterium]|nr:hypothetical protein [Candidatus Limnocylindrales bacterium]